MGQSVTLLEIDYSDDEIPNFTEMFFGINPIGNFKKSIDLISKSVSGEKTNEGKKLAISNYKSDQYPEHLYLPIYNLSAEEIFKGNILMFDVDFFNPKEIYIKESASSIYSRKMELTEEGKKYWKANFPDLDEEAAIEMIKTRYDLGHSPTNGNQNLEQARDEYGLTKEEFEKYLNDKSTKLSDLSKEELAKKDIEYYYFLDENGQEVKTSTQNTASAISGVVSKWYNALRNIALVLMMSILLYIGIRMLISSVSADKAKYKQMLVDWLVGMCLLFFLHYIMAFSITMTKQFTKIINSVEEKQQVVVFEDDENNKLSETLKTANLHEYITDDGKIIWPTNLMGRLRIAAEMRKGLDSYIGYSICFVVLVFYTVFFSFTYLKRVIYLAFLTLIAPLIALTYPIDKVNDGQAQGFNKWLKEYVFNLLIQPLHLLLYIVLINSVFSFSSENIWYMLVAIGFLIPAEKLLRNLFGFEKAFTPGSLAGAAVGAGLISSGVGGLLGKIPNGPHRSHGTTNNNERIIQNEKSSPKMRFKDNNFNATSAIIGGGGLITSAMENKDKSNNSKTKLNMPRENRNKKNNSNNKSSFKLPNSRRKLTLKRGKENVIRPGRKLKKRALGLGRVLKTGGKKVFTSQNGRRLSNIGKSLGKTSLKFATSATLGGVAGTIGVAAGIASGDVSNAVQYGAAGMGAGIAAGSKMVDAAGNVVGTAKDKISDGYNKSSNTIDEMKRAYYGDQEYEQKELNKQVAEWKKDDENKKVLRNEFGTEATQEMYDSGEIDQYLKHNINDVTDMINMHKLQKEGVADGVEQAVAVHEYAKRTGDTTKMKKKDKDEWKETFAEEFRRVGHSEEDAKKASEDTFDKINSYNKIKTKL